jgi:hypothetical protein
MARIKPASTSPTGSRSINLELDQDGWESLVDCLLYRRLYLEQRRLESARYDDPKAVDHYSERIEDLSGILLSVYQQIDANHYAKQIQALRKGEPTWPQLATP